MKKMEVDNYRPMIKQLNKAISSAWEIPIDFSDASNKGINVRNMAMVMVVMVIKIAVKLPLPVFQEAEGRERFFADLLMKLERDKDNIIHVGIKK